MAESQLTLDGIEPTIAPPLRGKQQIPCEACGKIVARKPSEIGEHVFCSGQCYATSRPERGGKLHVTCLNCGTDMLRWRCHVKQRNFCSPTCRDSHGRIEVKCWWPTCDKMLKTRKSLHKGYEVYKTQLSRRSYYVRYPLCPEHIEHAVSVLGADVRFNAMWKIVAYPELPRSSRGISRAMRFVIWTLSGECCAACRGHIEFNAPRGSWHIDHRIPVMSGGQTVVSNLQALCRECHNVKSHPEKSISAQRRHAGQKLGRWLTHREKDDRLNRVEQELVALKTSTRELQAAFLALMCMLAASSRRRDV